MPPITVIVPPVFVVVPPVVVLPLPVIVSPIVVLPVTIVVPRVTIFVPRGRVARHRHPAACCPAAPCHRRVTRRPRCAARRETAAAGVV